MLATDVALLIKITYCRIALLSIQLFHIFTSLQDRIPTGDIRQTRPFYSRIDGNTSIFLPLEVPTPFSGGHLVATSALHDALYALYASYAGLHNPFSRL